MSNIHQNWCASSDVKLSRTMYQFCRLKAKLGRHFDRLFVFATSIILSEVENSSCFQNLPFTAWVYEFSTSVKRISPRNVPWPLRLWQVPMEPPKCRVQWAFDDLSIRVMAFHWWYWKASVKFCIIKYNLVQYSTVQCSTLHYCTVKYSAV